MTPDIIDALADIIDAIAGGWNRSDGSRVVPDAEHKRLEQAANTLIVEMDCGVGWREVAAALRALARPDVGLPEGWTIDSDGEATNGLICVGPDGVKGIWIDGRWAPAEVVRAVLLRAAGVAS